MCNITLPCVIMTLVMLTCAAAGFSGLIVYVQIVMLLVSETRASTHVCQRAVCCVGFSTPFACVFLAAHIYVFCSEQSLCQAHLQYLIHVRSCAACYKRLSIPAMPNLCLCLVVVAHCSEFNRLALPMQCRAFAIMQSSNKTTHCPNRA